eukprot:5742329-Pleurochrysis_carterae.AAC.1
MDPYTRVSPSAARRAAAPRPANTAPSICITLPRPAMDALMRARDIAAQHARAEAEAQRAQAQAAAETDADIARQRSSIAVQHTSAKANAPHAQDEAVAQTDVDLAHQRPASGANRHTPRDQHSPLLTATSADAQPLTPDVAPLDPRSLNESRSASLPRQISTC